MKRSAYLLLTLAVIMFNLLSNDAHAQSKEQMAHISRIQNARNSAVITTNVLLSDLKRQAEDTDPFVFMHMMRGAELVSADMKVRENKLFLKMHDMSKRQRRLTNWNELIRQESQSLDLHLLELRRTTWASAMAVAVYMTRNTEITPEQWLKGHGLLDRVNNLLPEQ